MTVNRRWLLVNRPQGLPCHADFTLEQGTVPRIGPGQILVRSLYFGLDPIQRLWLAVETAGMPPVGIGEPVRGTVIGQVVASNDPVYAEGDIVEGLLSWQDYVVADTLGPMPLRKLPKGPFPLSWHLGVLGVPGLTAYFGVTLGLDVRGGETVVVSGATGATGSTACQIARHFNARVIGIAGGSDKCAWVVENAVCDAAVDYRLPDYPDRLRELAPQGVNAYFDNVGAEMLDNLLLQMAAGGRILICGAMSQGYGGMVMQGPSNYMRIATHELRMSGVSLFRQVEMIPETIDILGRLLTSGALRPHETVVEGFELAPELLPTMFTGKSPGKLVVHVGDPE